MAVTQCLAVGTDGVADGIVLQAGEVKAVGHFDLAVGQVGSFKAYILVGVLHFRHGGVGRAVGAYDTVAQEVAVAWHVFAEVASVSIIGCAVLVLDQQALVNPVPDVSALQVGITIDGLPLIPKVAVGVAHGMGIFGRYDGTVAACFPDFLEPLGTGVLGNVHIGVPFPLGPFVVDRTVHFFLPFQVEVGLVEVVSVSGFVAQ